MRAGLLFFLVLPMTFFCQEEESRRTHPEIRVRLVENSSDYKTDDAQFVDGTDRFKEYLKNYDYKEVEKLPAIDTQLCTVCFIVNKLGQFEDFSFSPKVDLEYLRFAARIIVQMPEWAPAKEGGEKIKSSVCLTFLFTSKMVLSPILTVTPPAPPMSEDQKKSIPEREIVDFPDIDAEFPGGKDSMMLFIQRNLEYPDDVETQGRVYIAFVVEKEGQLTQVRVERGVSAELDAEARRLVRSMPKWIPALIGEKKVASRVRIPITFTLD